MFSEVRIMKQIAEIIKMGSYIGLLSSQCYFSFGFIGVSVLLTLKVVPARIGGSAPSSVNTLTSVESAV